MKLNTLHPIQEFSAVMCRGKAFKFKYFYLSSYRFSLQSEHQWLQKLIISNKIVNLHPLVDHKTRYFFNENEHYTLYSGTLSSYSQGAAFKFNVFWLLSYRVLLQSGHQWFQKFVVFNKIDILHSFVHHKTWYFSDETEHSSLYSGGLSVLIMRGEYFNFNFFWL